jgi:hypothetical protein
MSEKGEPMTIMSIDPGVGESWFVTTVIGSPVEEGGEFSIVSIHKGVWPVPPKEDGDDHG